MVGADGENFRKLESIDPGKWPFPIHLLLLLDLLRDIRFTRSQVRLLRNTYFAE